MGRLDEECRWGSELFEHIAGAHDALFRTLTMREQDLVPNLKEITQVLSEIQGALEQGGETELSHASVGVVFTIDERPLPAWLRVGVLDLEHARHATVRACIDESVERYGSRVALILPRWWEIDGLTRRHWNQAFHQGCSLAGCLPGNHIAFAWLEKPTWIDEWPDLDLDPKCIFEQLASVKYTGLGSLSLSIAAATFAALYGPAPLSQPFFFTGLVSKDLSIGPVEKVALKARIEPKRSIQQQRIPLIVPDANSDDVEGRPHRCTWAMERLPDALGVIGWSVSMQPILEHIVEHHHSTLDIFGEVLDFRPGVVGESMLMPWSFVHVVKTEQGERRCELEAPGVLETLLEREPGLVFLEGEAHQGKSTFLEWVRWHIARHQQIVKKWTRSVFLLTASDIWATVQAIESIDLYGACERVARTQVSPKHLQIFEQNRLEGAIVLLDRWEDLSADEQHQLQRYCQSESRFLVVIAARPDEMTRSAKERVELVGLSKQEVEDYILEVARENLPLSPYEHVQDILRERSSILHNRMLLRLMTTVDPALIQGKPTTTSLLRATLVHLLHRRLTRERSTWWPPCDRVGELEMWLTCSLIPLCWDSEHSHPRSATIERAAAFEWLAPHQGMDLTHPYASAHLDHLLELLIRSNILTLDPMDASRCRFRHDAYHEFIVGAALSRELEREDARRCFECFVAPKEDASISGVWIHDDAHEECWAHALSLANLEQEFLQWALETGKLAPEQPRHMQSLWGLVTRLLEEDVPENAWELLSLMHLGLKQNQGQLFSATPRAWRRWEILAKVHIDEISSLLELSDFLEDDVLRSIKQRDAYLLQELAVRLEYQGQTSTAFMRSEDALIAHTKEVRILRILANVPEEPEQEEILEAVAENPDSVRMLALGLECLGQALLERQDLQGALSAHTQQERLFRALLGFGETFEREELLTASASDFETTRHFAMSLRSVGEVLWEVERSLAARSALDESVRILRLQAGLDEGFSKTCLHTMLSQRRDAIRDLSVALGWLGYILQSLQEFERAVSIHREDVKILHALADLAPGFDQHAASVAITSNAIAVRELAVGLGILGEALNELDPPEGEFEARQSVLIFRALTTLDEGYEQQDLFAAIEDNPTTVQDMASALRSLGDILGMKDDYEAAHRVVLEEVCILRALTGLGELYTEEELVGAIVQAPDPVRRLSAGLCRLGESFVDLGRFDRASVAHHEEVSILRTLTGLDSEHTREEMLEVSETNPHLIRDLAIGLARLGEVAVLSGFALHGLPSLQESVQILRALAGLSEEFQEQDLAEAIVNNRPAVMDLFVSLCALSDGLHALDRSEQVLSIDRQRDALIRALDDVSDRDNSS